LLKGELVSRRLASLKSSQEISLLICFNSGALLFGFLLDLLLGAAGLPLVVVRLARWIVWPRKKSSSRCKINALRRHVVIFLL
jgi:hypothetical protein